MTNPPTTERPVNWPALIETVLLTGTAAVLLTKTLRGVLVYYMHPRYAPLVVGCALVLLLIAGVRMRAIFGPPEPLRPLRGAYLLLALPLLLGTLVPARPLGADALVTASLESSLAGTLAPADADTTRWTLLDWATALSIQPETTPGQPVDVVGFVYHDADRPLDGFFVARYVITCCTADGSGVGLPVVWPEGADLAADAWVRVRGELGVTLIDGQEQPAILAGQVELVPQPQNPYLYP